MVQLREKQLEARALLARAAVAAEVCRRDRGVPFVLNDRPDLALAAGADGVHVGQDDAPVALARRILGPDAIVGLSTHGPGDLASAADEDVDYISAGPVEPTPTKPGRRGTGLGYVTLASERSSVPVFVTGGVTPERIPALAAAGVRHFVVVRYLTEAGDAESGGAGAASCHRSQRGVPRQRRGEGHPSVERLGHRLEVVAQDRALHQRVRL